MRERGRGGERERGEEKEGGERGRGIKRGGKKGLSRESLSIRRLEGSGIFAILL